MKERLMTKEEVIAEIAYEDVCGVNTLLQELLIFEDANVFMQVDENGVEIGYILRDKKTGQICWDMVK